MKLFRYSDELDGAKVVVISATWCKSRSGIVLQFAVPVEVMDIESMVEYSTQFMKVIRDQYSDLLRNDFFPKTKSPIVCSTNGGEVMLLWCFQGVDDKPTRQALKENEIEEIKYE